MVPPSHAVPHRTHEEDRPLIASASRTDPQLFPGSKTTFQRCGRGPEQQSQSHYPKILRVPHLSRSRTCPLSLTWQATRARIHPRILLTNQSFKSLSVVVLTSGSQFIVLIGEPRLTRFSAI